MVLYHHERIDGSGYPYGMIGEHVLLEAKIIGVADVVAALATHRIPLLIVLFQGGEREYPVNRAKSHQTGDDKGQRDDPEYDGRSAGYLAGKIKHGYQNRQQKPDHPVYDSHIFFHFELLEVI
jgi:hypothetical protein